ncbi:endogenous retrovirus group K member 6 Pro protein-like, partial [Meriones unguiculatus]|uniref:endogenous retrovirus group K member 6 Pro protein-like n=1 Tax=Meriones unguiculatus TaxID=10047 RepID=UPI00293E52FD
MPQLGVQPVPVEFEDPLPKGSVGLILGRSFLTLKGLIIHPGIIDQDYTGRLRVLCSCPQGVFSISPGDRIAQLVLLPSLQDVFPSTGMTRGNKGFGSSGADFAHLVVVLKTRPTLQLQIEGKLFTGILDTGADRSIISSNWWPKAWPVTQSSHSLQGLGYEASPAVSSCPLTWQVPEGQTGSFIPYVLPLPVNLWGRDILQDLGLALTNEYSQQAVDIMKRMGYKEGKGLGKQEQGRLHPISQESNTGKQGL